MHYPLIGRYEEKGALPSADVLGKLANALEVTSDYLMIGTSDNQAINSLTDKELVNQFKIIENQAKRVTTSTQPCTANATKYTPSGL